MFRCLTVTVIVVLGIADPARGTVNIWLSGAGDIPPGSSVPPTSDDVPNFYPYVGGSGTVYIWGRPDTGKFLENISLNLVAETPGVIAFTSVTMYNPSFSPPSPVAQRFEFVDDSTSDPDNPLPISADSIEGMAGFTVLNNGTPQAVGIGSTADSYFFFDGTNPSWLIASVTYDVLSTGEGTETELFLEIGPAGMNHAGYGTDDHSVVFGDAMDTPLTDVCILDEDGCNHIYRGFHGDDDEDSYYDALISRLVLPGDADRNGAVEQADFEVWRATFGSTTLLAADHNGNGTVDAADYVIWRKNLGLSAGSGAAMGVPEPSAAVLASIALTALLAAGRRSIGPNS